MTDDEMTPGITHHHVLMKPDTLSSIRVGSGSLALSEAKNVLNLGSTKAARMMIVTTARPPRRRDR